MTNDYTATELSSHPETFPDIPGFEIMHPLGRGGMGKVYLARQLDNLNRMVVVKTILEKHVGDYFHRKFLEEGQRQAELHHPNILPIFAAGEANGILYLAMHYARDGTLRDRLSKGSLSITETVDIVFDVLKGLRHAHEDLDTPLAHLDIKPENILFDGENVLIADFGIARKVEETAVPGSLTAGDPRYWPPEQQANNATTQSDMFALGTMFFEMLAGQRPPIPNNVVTNQAGVDALRKKLPTEARKYAPLISRCLHKVPHERPTAKEMLSQLRRLQRGSRSASLPLLAGALLVALAFLGAQPSTQQTAQSVWQRLFPAASYTVTFDVAPFKAELWVDGTEQTFRELPLAEGLHQVAVVADGYVGQREQLYVRGEGQSFTFTLEALPAPSDEEYLRFSGEFGEGEQLNSADWREPTLINLARLSEVEKSDQQELDRRFRDLNFLAQAGDVVAATSLFYAAFEGIGFPGREDAYMPGLIAASDSGYALASILRALYILQQLLEAGQTFNSNPHSYAQVEDLLVKAFLQGLPKTAELAAATAGISLPPDLGSRE